MIAFQPSDTLIVVDIQNDFIPNGALAVPSADEIIEKVNELLKYFPGKIVFTQDWHPAGHMSFASAHEGLQPFDSYENEGIGPVLWPDHCVQGTKGAEFHPDLNIVKAHLIIRKGFNPNIDSYSAFLENDKKTKTGLAGYLKSIKTSRVFVCGLAFDYCVGYTALDAKAEGFEVIIIEDLTKGITTESIESMKKQLLEQGILLTTSMDLR